MSVEGSEESAMKGAKKLLEFGPAIAIVTLGARGVVVTTKDTEPRLVPTPKVKATDTTVCSLFLIQIYM